MMIGIVRNSSYLQSAALLLFSLLYLSWPSRSSSFGAHRVTYISFLAPIDPNVAESWTTDSVISLTTCEADDSPLELVSLPWKFNLFGVAVDKVFASPNGYLSTSPALPCGAAYPGFSNGVACDLDNAYYNSIAGILTDLNPSKSPRCSVSARYTKKQDRVTVQYKNIIFNNITALPESYENSFRITLFADSHVEIYYDKIYKGTSFPVHKGWVSGLRSPEEEEHSVLSSTQEVVGLGAWSTDVPGVYPSSPADVSTGKVFTACPLSTAWCMTPMAIDADNTATIVAGQPEDDLLLTPLMITCVDEIEMAIEISPLIPTAAPIAAPTQSPIPLSAGDENATRVVYVSFTTTIASDPDITEAVKTGPSTVLETIMAADDSPVELITLPFDFSYLGQLTDKAWASPNGVVQFDPLLPCGRFAPYFLGGGCNVNKSYYNLVAGYLTDLNPGSSPHARIATATVTATSDPRRDRLTVTFENLRYYNATTITSSAYDNSFRVSLFRDSHIEIHYDKIYDGSLSKTFPLRQLWFSGLRGSYRTAITVAQRNTGVNEWGTEVAGVYPADKAAVATGNMFTACPFSASWCAYPNSIDLALPSVHTYLTLTPLRMSCESKLDMGFVLLNSSQAVACQVLSGSGVVRCSISDILALGLAAGSYSILPAWRIKASTGAYETLPVDPLVLKIYNSSEAANNASSSDNVCAVYSRLVAAELPCDSPSEPVLYSYPTCQGSCGSAFGASDESYYLDEGGNCCVLANMDCAGVCGGGSTVGLNSEGDLMCCGYHAVSPFPAYLADVCGVCAGAATDAKKCPTASPTPRPTGQFSASPTVSSPSTASLTAAPSVQVHPPTPAPSNSPYWRLLPCKILTVGSQPGTVRCSISDILALGLAAGSYSILPAWRIKASTGAYETLPVDPLVLKIYNNSEAANNASRACAVNDIEKKAGFGCGECVSCTRNISCLDLPCDSPAEPVLYSYPSCKGSCDAVGAGTASYFTDAAGKCCALADMDCAGVCAGTSVRSYFPDDGALTCCPKSRVDCLGICDGSAVLDACKVCNGDKSAGQPCFNTSAVAVSTGDTNDDGEPVLYPVFDLADVASGGSLSTVLRLVVTNSGKYNLTSYLSLLPDADYAPDFPELARHTDTLLPAFTTTTLLISASLQGLLGGTQKAWTVKTLDFHYYRPEYSNSITQIVTASIRVYPSMASCGLLSFEQSALCAKLPSCIVCASTSASASASPLLIVNGSNRVNHDRTRGVVKLKSTNGAAMSVDGAAAAAGGDGDGVGDGDGDGDRDGSDSTGRSVRRLFMDIIPTWDDAFYQAQAGGVCVDGWRSEDCTSSGAVRAAEVSAFGVSGVVAAVAALTSIAEIFF